MAKTLKRGLGVPQKTLGVSRARSELTRLLRRLRTAPEIYLITQSGKPAGALVNPEWLENLQARARGEKRFSIFGHDRVAEDWEQVLRDAGRKAVEETLAEFDELEKL